MMIYIIAPLAMHGQRTAQPDTAQNIEIREPSQEQIKSYVEDNAFSYTTTPQESETLLDKIKYWIQRQISKLLSNAASQQVIEVIFYIFLVALLIMLVNQYMRGNINHLFLGSDNTKPSGFSIEQTDQEKENMDRLINEAINNSNYKLATRYLYQKNLLRLQEQGYIHWKKNKTNHDYIYEIKQRDLQKLFREVTQYYEYTEYGGFALNAADFQKVHQRFKKMQTLMGAGS